VVSASGASSPTSPAENRLPPRLFCRIPWIDSVAVNNSGYSEGSPRTLPLLEEGCLISKSWHRHCSFGLARGGGRLLVEHFYAEHTSLIRGSPCDKRRGFQMTSGRPRPHRHGIKKSPSRSARSLRRLSRARAIIGAPGSGGSGRSGVFQGNLAHPATTGLEKSTYAQPHWVYSCTDDMSPDWYPGTIRRYRCGGRESADRTTTLKTHETG
jgi:hypothetical protein